MSKSEHMLNWTASSCETANVFKGAKKLYFYILFVCGNY